MQSQIFFADLIDAAWDGSASGGDVLGNTGSGDYTTFVWETGVGKGATITPARGDTGKTLFVPNAGVRYADGAIHYYVTRVYLLSTTQRDNNYAWRIRFESGYPSGITYADSKLNALSLRCVRS